MWGISPYKHSSANTKPETFEAIIKCQRYFHSDLESSWKEHNPKISFPSEYLMMQHQTGKFKAKLNNRLR